MVSFNRLLSHSHFIWFKFLLSLSSFYFQVVLDWLKVEFRFCALKFDCCFWFIHCFDSVLWGSICKLHSGPSFTTQLGVPSAQQTVVVCNLLIVLEVDSIVRQVFIDFDISALRWCKVCSILKFILFKISTYIAIAIIINRAIN